MSCKQHQPSLCGSNFELRGEITSPVRGRGRKRAQDCLSSAVILNRVSCGYVRVLHYINYYWPLLPLACDRYRHDHRRTLNVTIGALGILHHCVLAPFSIVSEVATKLTTIVGQLPIMADRDREEGADADKEGRLVALPGQGQLTPPTVTAGAARAGCRVRGGNEVYAGSWCGVTRSLGARL